MKFKMIQKDMFRNRAITATTMLFIAAAAMLVSLAAGLTISLSGSIDRLMTDARTPHFMQMHSGELPEDGLKAFAEQNPNVADFQVMEFLNVDSSQIMLGDNPLTGSLQDNGFCTQSEQFDFLLDLDQKRVQPQQGEVYVPVCYLKDGTARTGDAAVIGGMPFTIAGFVRDSQMNSTLASSKRFLVSEEDFQKLAASGSMEYLIEFRLKDLSELGAFETAYSSAGLPANGPSLTWPLFRMISAVSDGILIAVILLISLLVIIIALLCIRFTLLAKIEEDYREIGVMKAVGMRVSDIRSLYLAIYAAMAAMGGILGFLLSLPVRGPLNEQIRLNFGDSGNPALSLLAGLAATAVIVFLILFYVNGQLRRFRRISPVQAIRFGTEQRQGQGQTSTALHLSGNRCLPTNLFLAVKDVLSRKHLYLTMLVVIILASFIIIVPQNLYHTITSRDFVTYMGVGTCDLRLDIQQTDQIAEKTAAIGVSMEQDQDIARYALLTTKIFHAKQADGSSETIKIELGDHAVYPLQYTEGHSPSSDEEIALSILNAEELEKQVGDPITLLTGKGEKTLTVCGIYPDITNGGKTAKAAFSDQATPTAWSTICATLTDTGLLDEKIAGYGSNYPYAKISGIDEYVSQTFGQTLAAVQAASWIAILAAVAVTLLVTLLFMKLLVSKDRYSIAVMRAFGFTRSDISRQYAWRAVFVLAAGILAGTILASTLGEKLAGLAISSFGAAAFHFQMNPLFTCFLAPLILLAAALLATTWGTHRAGEISIYESIKE